VSDGGISLTIESRKDVGSEGIKIEKATGKIEDFYLPEEENFTLLDCSVKMDIAGGFDNAGGYENGNKP